MEKRKTNFLYLSEEDLIKVGVLDAHRCVDVLTDMFKLVSEGDYVMGGPNHNQHGIKLTFPDEPNFPGMPANGPERRFMAMIAYLGGRFQIAGEKWYGSNIANSSLGLPRSVLMVMLNNKDTGEPVALMSGNLISSMRTGCVPGVATRYLARKDSTVCSLIGAGGINRYCIKGIAAEAANLNKVVIYDIFPDSAERCAKSIKAEFGFETKIAATMEEAVRVGDIISIACSRVKPAVIADEWFKKGSTAIFTSISKVDKAYWAKCKLYFDNAALQPQYMEDAKRSGDVQKYYDGEMAGVLYEMVDDGQLPRLTEFPSLGDIVRGLVPGRENNDERIAVMTDGMAVEDVAWAYDCYQRAIESGIGIELKLWDAPYMA